MKEYYSVCVYNVNNEEIGGFNVEKDKNIDDVVEILKNEFDGYYKITIN